MAGNLTAQVRNIADVTALPWRAAICSRKITVDVRGEILALKETINTMVDQLGSFASVTRVALARVGTEGKLGGQANVLSVAGTRKDLTDSVNSMASNLTNQVRNIAEVTSCGRPRRPLRAKSPSTCAVKFCPSKTRSTPWSISFSSFASESHSRCQRSGNRGANWVARPT